MFEDFAVKILLHGVPRDNNFDDVKSQMLNELNSELQQFQDKSGLYANRPHIHKLEDINNNKSWQWHRMHSQHTKWLWKLAMRCCGKILGIGSAERTWHIVKLCKSGKRAHLSSKATDMQSTIFGNWATTKANARRQLLASKSIFTDTWVEEDFEKVSFGLYGIDSDELNKKVSSKPVRTFKAYKETWEKELLKKDDVVVQARFAAKYAGLVWEDPDNKMLLNRAANDLVFNSVRGHDRGWMVVGLFPTYDPRNVRSCDFDHWRINHELFGLIYEYYKKNRDPSIFVDVNPESLDEDGDWIYDHCGIEAAEQSRNREAGADDSGKTKKSKKRRRK